MEYTVYVMNNIFVGLICLSFALHGIVSFIVLAACNLEMKRMIKNEIIKNHIDVIKNFQKLLVSEFSDKKHLKQ